jgi:hypothetical protein
MVPNRLHQGVLSRVHDERRSRDVFPTVYRCNTRRRLARGLDAAGFDAAVYGYEAEPVYLAFSTLTYRLGMLHGRLAPSALRVGLHAFARRREGPPPGTVSSAPD